MKLIIPHPMPLSEALELFFPESSKRTRDQWVKFGRIVVDGQVVNKNQHEVAAGQTLSLEQKKIIPSFRGIKVLHQDRSMIVIDKPPNLLSVATDNPGTEHALGLLRAYYQTESIYPVHRIDRETSGILLFAKGQAAQNYFDALFEKHEIIRQYFAVVEGNLYPDEGTWTSYLSEMENFDVKTTSKEEGGRLAITHYSVIRRSKKFTYLKLQLETGRKHQIRVHCQQAGFPIVGDKRYGSLCNPVGRMFLHACFLQFIHPITKKEISFTSALPKSFQVLGAV